MLNKIKILKILSVLILPLSLVIGESVIIHGHVYDYDTGNPIKGANIIVENLGTYTDEFGAFSLITNSIKPINIILIGYKTRIIEFTEKYIEVFLESEPIEILPIEVSANRVIAGVTPVAYSNLSFEEVENHYSVEDVPMVLSSEPGVHAYSESGNGTGYSYLSIRGFDQSRISVMLDNVPLNDNESHQVYWVDHGDILSDALDVEIQRGIGNSLYGSSAFGGSINIQTKIKSPVEKLSFDGLIGSYNTYKGNIKYYSGDRLGKNWDLTTRISSIKSNGYRDDSKSDQTAFSLGIQHSKNNLTNKFRALIGKEVSVLQWDGIDSKMLNDRNLRTGKMDWTVPFIDDFVQQLYSLNTRFIYNPNVTIRNVIYLVKGLGFYEVEKFGQDYYSYNLDIEDEYSEDEELMLEADFTRRKWIQNTYFGVVPTFTYNKGKLRTDVGIESRVYSGDHHGEVMDVFDPILRSKLPSKYRYYEYVGNKSSMSVFAHVLYSFPFDLHITGDIQFQKHDWKLEQESIGHALGHDLSANWQFANPRFGLTYGVNKNISIFGNYGTAQKEPSDDQIIEADDVWSLPKEVASEKIKDYEAGINILYNNKYLKVNFYRIDYLNEILSDIYDFAEGEFDIESADKTRHEGVEIEGGWEINRAFTIRFNGAFSKNKFKGGEYSGKTLVNVPSALTNITVDYNPNKFYGLYLYGKYVGKQFIDINNSRNIAIDPYFVVNLSGWIKYDQVKVTARINNIFDTLYATYGYEYFDGYYWPGATRNFTLSLEFDIL